VRLCGYLSDRTDPIDQTDMSGRSGLGRAAAGARGEVGNFDFERQQAFFEDVDAVFLADAGFVEEVADGLLHVGGGAVVFDAAFVGEFGCHCFGVISGDFAFLDPVGEGGLGFFLGDDGCADSGEHDFFDVVYHNAGNVRASGRGRNWILLFSILDSRFSIGSYRSAFGVDSAWQRAIENRKLFCVPEKSCEDVRVISSVTFRNFRALKSASLSLAPFNLVIGPNGSGKTSLIQALLRLRALARLPLRNAGASEEERERIADGPELWWQFSPPHDGLEAVMKCLSERECDFLDVTALPTGQGQNDWAGLRAGLLGIRAYVLDYRALGARSVSHEGAELKGDGGNLATVLAALQMHAPGAFGELRDELCRILPEYDDVQWQFAEDSTVELSLRLAESGELIPAERLSQGTLYLLAMMALAFDPKPPSMVCIEEVDRGFHPRLLRDVRDVLYRLSYPESFGLKRAPVQVVVTTHSPYLLDLFSEHPEEVVISEKLGAYARLWRLSERKDLVDLLAEGGDASGVGGCGLGEMWFSGILGGVPQEKS